MKLLLLLLLLASCRQAPSQAVVESVWPPPADAFDLPAVVSQVQAPAAVTLAAPVTQ